MAAALTHWSVAVLALPWCSPLWANVLGFAVAFQVSFLGHWRWSFRQQNARWQQALPRFAVVASTSFGCNELMLAGLLRWTAWPVPVSLALVLVAVASLTFVLSRFWAFARA